VTAAGIVLIALLRMQLQPPAAPPAPAPAPAADQVVVTAAPSIDAQRLADALRVYLDEFGIRVGAGAAGEAGDLRKRLDDARQLGEAVRAVAVVRAEHGARGTVEIELIDLATDKALVVSVPRPARDEDLYRALALKIHGVEHLRLHLAIAQATAALDDSIGERALAVIDVGNDGEVSDVIHADRSRHLSRGRRPRVVAAKAHAVGGARARDAAR